MDSRSGRADQRRIAETARRASGGFHERADVTTSTPSYHETASPETVPTPAIRDYRFLTTDDLVSECDYLMGCRLDVKERGGDTSYFDATIVPMIAEIEGRRRLQEKYHDDPLCPSWPNMNDQRYQDLLANARDLKAIWSIDRFLTTVVGVELKRTGPHTYKGRCPLHSDSTPSLVAYTNDDHFHCFGGGCGAHGDIFYLTGAYFGIDSFPDQVHKVEDITGMMVESARIILANEEEVSRHIGEVLS